MNSISVASKIVSEAKPISRKLRAPGQSVISAAASLPVRAADSFGTTIAKGVAGLTSNAPLSNDIFKLLKASAAKNPSYAADVAKRDDELRLLLISDPSKFLSTVQGSYPEIAADFQKSVAHSVCPKSLITSLAQDTDKCKKIIQGLDWKDETKTAILAKIDEIEDPAKKASFIQKYVLEPHKDSILENEETRTGLCQDALAEVAKPLLDKTAKTWTGVKRVAQVGIFGALAAPMLTEAATHMSSHQWGAAASALLNGVSSFTKDAAAVSAFSVAPDLISHSLANLLNAKAPALIENQVPCVCTAVQQSDKLNLVTKGISIAKNIFGIKS